MMIVVVEKDVYYSVDGIHRETLTKGESKTKNETQSTKKKTK